MESLLFLSDLTSFLIGHIINRDISNFERKNNWPKFLLTLLVYL